MTPEQIIDECTPWLIGNNRLYSYEDVLKMLQQAIPAGYIDEPSVTYDRRETGVGC